TSGVTMNIGTGKTEPRCALDEIPEYGSRALSAGDEELVAVRKSNRVYVYRNNCPHDHIPLNWRPHEFLDDSGTLIECVNPGALFAPETGECVSGPCVGECLEAVDVSLKDGFLYLSH